MDMHRPVIHFSIALLTLATGFCSAKAELVAYWSFDSDFSAGVGDPSFDATAFNGAQINNVQSKFGGGAAHFDKELMTYAATTGSPALDGTYSFSHWFYLDVETTGPIPDRQYSTVNSNNPESEPSLFFNIDGDEAADFGNDDDFLVSRVLTDGAAPWAFVFTPLPNPWDHRQWVNYIATAVYDEVSNTTTLSGYLNGEFVGEHTGPGKPRPSTHLVFGADRETVGRFWNGWIDDVAIYDHVLTASEIAGLQSNAAPDVGSGGQAGDYNGDGSVDAADYTVWRNGLGATSTLLNRSPSNTDPLVNQDDYAFWKANFGEGGSGSGRSSAGAVPEPATLSLYFLALVSTLAILRVR